MMVIVYTLCSQLLLHFSLDLSKTLYIYVTDILKMSMCKFDGENSFIFDKMAGFLTAIS